MRKGFSLVELSIVLVILGLMAGGILMGQSLIRNAELKSITTEFEKYNGAAIAFRQKYDALPGDFPIATQIWNAQAAGAACVTAASTGAATCNGDDDGIILPSTNSNESFRFWQHLKNAGYIEGSFNGIAAGSNSFATDATNAPRGRINNSFWFAWWWGTQSGQPSFFDGVYDNFLEYGAYVANGDPANPIMRPAELWNIDVKIDDGKPATGMVVMRGLGVLNTCSTTNSSSTLTAEYLLSNNNIACNAIFRRLFKRI